jgi:hypothetical protein
MKIKPTLLIVMISLALVQFGHAEELMQSFSGILWGTPIEEIRDLQESARDGDIHYYKRAEDFYTIAGVTLSDVIYGFYQGKYFAAYLKLTSGDSVTRIKRHLDTVYGPARSQLRINQTIFIWDYLDVKIKLKQYQNQPQAKLSFYYVPLSTKANKIKTENAKEKVFKLESGEPEYDF